MRRNSATSKKFSLWDLVVKVFRKDYSLETLQRQWPPQMLSSQADEFWHIQVNQNPFHNILGGVFIRKGEFKNRFAFLMLKYPGDLHDAEAAQDPWSTF
jgi:hypothetical protein